MSVLWLTSLGTLCRGSCGISNAQKGVKLGRLVILSKGQLEYKFGQTVKGTHTTTAELLCDPATVAYQDLDSRCYSSGGTLAHFVSGYRHLARVALCRQPDILQLSLLVILDDAVTFPFQFQDILSSP